MLVHEQATGEMDPGYRSTDINTTAIKNIIEKVFMQACVDFNVIRLPEDTVNFDLDIDGKIKVRTDNKFSDEMLKIITACGDKDYDYNIFIVNNPSLPGKTGFMKIGQKYGFVFGGNNANFRTVAHELGHGLNLIHTKRDAKNIMYDKQSSSKWRLRDDQWETLRNEL